MGIRISGPRGGAGAWCGVAALSLAAGCGGGGGGTEPPAIQLAFQAPTSTTGEGGTANFTVVLRTGAALAQAVTVDLEVLSGTATAGTDTQSFVGAQVSFPMGATDGATQVLPIAVTDDASVEGDDETLVVRLASPTGGAAIWGHAQHTLTIGDDDMATVAFDSASSATADESAGAHAIGVVLDLPPGGDLAVDLDVQYVDLLTGSATQGVDYAAVGTRTLTIPAGSADGASFALNVTVQPDTDVEGDETVGVELRNPSVGAQLGATREHTMTITEDDVLAAGSVYAQLDGGSPLAGGESVPFAAAPVGSGPSAPVSFQLTNSGSSPLAVSPITLTGDDGDFSIATSGTVSAGAEALPTPAAFPGGADAPDADPEDGRSVEWDALALADLAGRDRVILDGVPLPGGGTTSLDLVRLPLPFRADSVLMVDGEPVPGGPEAVLGDLSLWRGGVLGMEGSDAFLAFSSDGSRGWIRPDESFGSEIELVSDGRAEGDEAPALSRFVYTASQEPAQTGPPCGGARLRPDGGSSEPLTPQAMTTGLELAECRLAIETDYQLYQKFGSVSATTNYVTELIAAVSQQYEIDVQTRLTIAYLGVHSNSNDGWTSQDGGGDAGDLLDEFRAAWAPSSWPVEADLAHFLSGASLGGGIAYVSALCSQNFGFGVSGSLHGQTNWATWDFSPTVMSWDFVVVAHELGHNFGASHTHSYCPPIDDCYSNCDGTTNCPRGTIMSYCHLCGGMSNIDLEFHPFIADRMRANVQSSCLDTASLPGGTAVTFDVSFDPTSSAGAKSATMSFTHDSSDLPSPFTLNLTGTAQ